jgi:PKD repeat protein
MTLKYIQLLGAATIMMVSASAFSQCPSCTPDYTCVADGFPVLCPDVLPDGTTGEEYLATATFNMPGSVVDPGSGITATLESITITSITGLPFGLTLTPSNPSGVYYPSNGEDYGCATICGTPLAAGEYFVNINVAVVASAFGITQNLSESFSLPLSIIQGAGGGNASFNVSENSGCSPLNVDIENLITGAGVSYDWDFGGPSNGSVINLEVLTDNYPAETTWMVMDSDGELLISGGPYSDAQTTYNEQICVGPGSYTLIINDSYGDGMQFEGVIGSYVLTDGGGNILAQIVEGGNFGANATHNFTIDESNLVGGCVLNSANPSVLYDEPGSYTISLATTVTQLTLTSLEIIQLGDGWGGDAEDFFGLGNPDPYFVINGDVSFTSSVVTDQLTADFNDLNIPLTYGENYNVTFYDQDGPFTSDDNLGSASFFATGPGVYTIYGGGNVAIINITETISAEFFDSEIITVFEGLDVWADLDGDGYGDINSPVNGCDPTNTTPYAFNSEDCNDLEALMFPGGAGTLSGIDNDCNTIIEGDEILTIEGCTDPMAENYEPSATVNDESCIYSTCFGDFNNDGVITVTDLLELLADFGCTSDCATDLNEDDLVSVADLLQILAVFGSICP